jgi:opacity protein-like surface antigen
MKLTHRLLPALAILASIMAAPALAADSDQIIPAPVIEDNYVPVEIGTGWYIRGDVGYNFGGRQNDEFYDLTPVTFDNSYADAINVGVGWTRRLTGCSAAVSATRSLWRQPALATVSASM